MGKYVFDSYFDGDDKKNEILAPFIDCHDPVRTVSGNQLYKLVLSIYGIVFNPSLFQYVLQ